MRTVDAVADGNERDRALVGVDVGGTFTDVVVWNRHSKELWLDKVPSTPSDQSVGTLVGIASALGKANLRPSQVSDVRHGTTVGTNILIQRTGAKTGLLTTRGFRDVLEIERTKRQVTYDFFWDRPAPLAARRFRREVGERMSSGGEVVVPLDESDVLREYEFLISQGVESIAVSFLNAYANPDHERQAVDLLRRSGAKVPLTCGSDILPDLHEFERTNLAVINAYVAPAISRYLAALKANLIGRGIDADVRVMQSNGGAMEIPYAEVAPVRLLLSGPSAGVTGAVHVARTLGVSDLVTFDMGGTSCDVCLVEGSAAQMTSTGKIAGFTLELLPALDISTIGAGGGSIAWIEGGALKVGPRSAGAVPGPACYGLGGREPTVTDAWVVAGYLAPSQKNRRAMTVLRQPAQDVVKSVADSLRLDVLSTAEGILRVVHANMVNAVKSVSVKRGRDPKKLTLVAYGGAGPLAAAAVARELGMRTILIPRHPGLVCALGSLVADTQYDANRSLRLALSNRICPRLNDTVAELVAGLRLRFRENQEGAIEFHREVSLRYKGQYHTLRLPLPETLDEQAILDLRTRFHSVFGREYGHSRPEQELELDSVRVVARQRGEADAHFGRPSNGSTVPIGERAVFVDGQALLCSVWDWGTLPGGVDVAGPVIIEEFDTTVWVPVGAVAHSMHDGSLVVEL